MIKLDGLKKIERDAARAQKRVPEDLMKPACRDVGKSFLRKVTNLTPVGKKPIWAGKAVLDKYWKDYKGGSLVRGWAAETEEEAKKGTGSSVDIEGVIAKKEIAVNGKTYSMQINNVMSFASYVEEGHKQTVGRFVPQIGRRLVRAWVNGQYFNDQSVNFTNMATPAILHGNVQRFLKDNFK